MKLFGGKRREQKTLSQEQRAAKRRDAENLALYAAFSAGTQATASSAGGPRGPKFDISNEQKIAAYNLLMNDKD